ncbi:YeeE/YedE thiosulfate transporter family protein [Candidatus Contubernalis alkaliaceticus]|uniref:YeeE/YedE thiosulfate transporter family protein n=1 Tax=Candidatus Contubernalis alkaliaceticus TaxID=338645 RepID=UPI0024096480|nr:YeeE/YedE thiosulfate transporter family protein [Candidatus Contubernalis alkalaceticus]UNC92775.1 YeeE/YedE family protein [Candidatus Contubernalis alkalaceticus]
MGEIERITAQKKTNKVKQPKIAVVVLLINLVICLFLFLYKPYLPGIWFFGLGFGYVLQRSRFCFAASFRDLIVLKNSTIMRAVIIAMVISTLGFYVYNVYFASGDAVGIFYPVGINTAIGAFLFGLGMVIAGGCASGVLMRMGEGYMMQWLAFVGLVMGSVMGSWSFGWWHRVLIQNAVEIILPDLLGWPLSLLTQLFFLGILYYAFLKWEQRQ